MSPEIKKTDVYACPLCDSLYHHYEKVEKCFSECQHKKKAAEEHAKKVSGWDSKMNEVRLRATSLDHLKKLIITSAKQNFGVVLEFDEFDFCFHDVSNSHSAPIGGETNFMRHGNRPTSYPGFEGNIKGKILKKGRDLDNEKVEYISHLFGDCFGRKGIQGINLHNGGGTDTFSYGVRLFLEDFPLIQQQFLELQGINDSHRAHQIKVANHHSKIMERADKLCTDDEGYSNTLKKIELIEKQISDLTSTRRDALELKGKIRNRQIQLATTLIAAEIPFDSNFKDQQKLDSLRQMFDRKWR